VICGRSVVFSTNITEILVKVALNTITITIYMSNDKIAFIKRSWYMYMCGINKLENMSFINVT
jgi:hypothetical protein